MSKPAGFAATMHSEVSIDRRDRPVTRATERVADDQTRIDRVDGETAGLIGQRGPGQQPIVEAVGVQAVA
jgi:hypothetical protein